MTKFLYVLVVILSALVTVWCSFSWTLCLAVFLGFTLLLLLLFQRQEEEVRARHETNWFADIYNFTLLRTKLHKETNSIVNTVDNNSYKDHRYLKGTSNVNNSRNCDQTESEDEDEEDIPASGSRLVTIMSNLEKSLTNNRFMSSLLSMFNRGSNTENDRPFSPPRRHNNKERKTGRNNRKRFAVGVDDADDGATFHMSPSSSFRISTSPRIVGSPRGRINTGYNESSRTAVSRRSDDNLSSFPMSTRPQTRRFAKSPGTPSSSSSLTTSPLPRFHRTACESPDRPGINPVGFTPHALQRPGVCYPSNSSPGVLPRVCLEKRIKIPLIETNVNKMSPVTVRIAPPEMGTNHSPKFTSSKQNPNNFSLPPDTSDVLSALREGTRKRTNVCGNDEDSMFESANTTAKRRRQESNHSTASSSSMPSLPDFLPDLSLCNFTQSSYMSPTSRYTVPSSTAVSSSVTVTHPSPDQVASSGVNSGVKRPVAPCAHLSPSENSPNSKRPRQEVKNNPILSSLSSSQRYRLYRKDPVKRKFLDSPELEDSNTSKKKSETNPNDNQQSEKPTSKLSRFIAESTKNDTETNSTSVSIATPDRQSEETQVSTNTNESKTTPDLRSRRKHLSFATPTIDLDRLSYANVYATKQDYENDRKAEQERVEKMLDRIATEKTTSDADLLSEKNIVGSSEETSVLTIPSTTLSSTSSTLTSTTTTTSLIVSSAATTTTTTSSSSITRILLAPTTTSSESPSSTLAVSTASATPTTTKASLLLASPLSSLLQVTSPSTSTPTSPSTSTLTTTSSATSTATLVPQTTTQATTGFFSSVNKPTETSTSLSSTSIPSATTPGQPFKPMFGSLAPTSTTTSNSLSLGGVQFASVPVSSSSSSSIPSTATSGFSFGTFTVAGSTSTTPATTTTSSFAFGTYATNPQASAITTATTQTNAGPSMFSSPSKDVSKPGGFSFNLISPQVTPTSAATQKSGSQSAASPFSTPNTSVPPATSSSLFSFTSTSAQSSTTASTTSASLSFGTAAVTLPTAATSTTPAPGAFVFTKSSTPSSLPQSSTTIPTTGMFTFKPSDTATKTSTTTIPTTKSTSGIFAFKADSTSAVTTASNQSFSFGGSGTNVNTPALSTSSTPSAMFGATATTNTFGSASSTFGATLATNAPKFGATSTNESAFSATSKALPPAFGTAIKPAFGATSSVSTPVFGANPASTAPPFASQSSATSPIFSSTDKSKPTFGVTSSPFGTSSTTASTPFGASSTVASTPFGVSSTVASTPFGASSTAASTPFGASSTPASTPFGASSTAASTPFGASSTAASTPFGASSTAASTPFGASSTAASTPFGASSTAASTPFGASSTAASTPFGTSTTASTAFGTSSTTFGASSNPSTLFGASAGQSNQTNASKSGTFTFVGSANTAQQTSTTSAPMTGFNFAFNSSAPSQKTFNFGAGGTSSSKAATSTTATVTTVAPSAVAGSTSIFGQASNAFGGFSSAGQDRQKPMFGSPSTNTSGFNFSGTATNQTTSVFGQTGQQSQNSDQPANQPFTFGQGSTPGNTSMPFGQSSAFSSPQASSFGSFGAKPTNVFSTPTNNSDKTSQPTPNIFGSTTAATPPNLTAQSKPLFGQVASQPFGTASGTPSTTGNKGLFGTTATGQVTTPAAGSPAPGIFTFGQSPGTPLQTAAPTTTNPNQGFDFSASLGGTSQFNFGQGGTPSKSTMFNMGSGNTTPKMRSSFPKGRRRGAKK